MSVYEGAVLDSLDLNDGTTYRLHESLEIAPPAKRLLWIAGREGDILGDVPGAERREVVARVRVWDAASMDSALTKIGAITDKLQKAERTNGGISLVWTPAGSTYSKTIKVLAGEVTGLPITPQGADAGWFKSRPIITIRLYCKPFLYGSETSYATVTSSNPHVVAMARSVAGDVPAEGRLILTDMATQERDFAEYGLDPDPITHEALALASATPTMFLRLGATSGLTDQSTGNHSGTGAGGITIGGYSTNLPLTGDDSTATDFDGSDDRITTSYAAYVAAGSITIAGWAYRDGSGAQHTLISGSTATSPELYLSSGSQNVNFTPSAGGTTTTWAAAWPGNTQWVHWALTFNDSSNAIALYINGVLVSATTNAQAYSTPGNLQIGSRNSTTSPFDGKMAQIGVWESILTADQIAQLATAGLNPYLIDNAHMSTTGLGGSGTTRSGAYQTPGVTNTVIRLTTQTNWVGICETGALPHYGPFRGKIRCWTDATDAQVRLAYKSGDAPFKRLNPIVVPSGLASQWIELDLGMLDIPRADLGTQRTIVRIEVKSATSNKTFDVDYYEHFPATRYGKARAPIQILTPPVFSAASGFDTESGVITGDALATGGNWTVVTNSDADDFSAAAGVATRTAVSDSGAGVNLLAGRGVTASTTNYTSIAASVDVSATNVAAFQNVGILARVVDSSNWVGATLSLNSPTAQLSVRKCVAGITTDFNAPTTLPLAANTFYTLRLVISAAGQFVFILCPQGAFTPLGGQIVTAADSALATGGTLASGRVGIIDFAQAATACTRTFDNFWAAVPETDAAIFSGKTGEFRPDDTLRQSSADAAIYGRPPVARGPGIFIPQAGSESKVTRVVAKAARNDIEAAPRDNIADSLKLQIYATSRHLVAPR